MDWTCDILHEPTTAWWKWRHRTDTFVPTCKSKGLLPV